MPDLILRRQLLFVGHIRVICPIMQMMQALHLALFLFINS